MKVSSLMVIDNWIRLNKYSISYLIYFSKALKGMIVRILLYVSSEVINIIIILIRNYLKEYKYQQKKCYFINLNKLNLNSNLLVIYNLDLFFI